MNRAQVSRGHIRLVGEQAIEAIVAGRLIDAEVGVSDERMRNMSDVHLIEHNRDEFLVVPVVSVYVVSDDRAFPVAAPTDTLRGVAEETFGVGLCDDAKDEAGSLNLVEHPAVPALDWEGRETINPRIYAIIAQPLGEIEDALLVLIVVPTVTDENARKLGLTHSAVLS